MANHRTAQTRPERGVANRLMPGGRYNVKGTFKHVEGEIEAAPDGSIERSELTVEARTINTRMPPRDRHLRGKEFLDVANHSQIRITAGGVDQVPDAKLCVTAVIELGAA